MAKVKFILNLKFRKWVLWLLTPVWVVQLLLKKKLWIPDFAIIKIIEAKKVDVDD